MNRYIVHRHGQRDRLIIAFTHHGAVTTAMGSEQHAWPAYTVTVNPDARSFDVIEQQTGDVLATYTAVQFCTSPEYML